MQTILFLAHTDADGSLAKPALEALNAAAVLVKSLPGTLAVGLIGDQTAPAANQIASCGASRFLAVSGPQFAVSRYATDAAGLETICLTATPDVVIAPATSRFSRVLAGLAQRLGGRADTHITAVTSADGKISAARWYYRQRMEAVLQRAHRPWFLLVDPGSQNAWQGTPGSASVETLPVAVTENPERTSVIGVREPATDVQTIKPEAQLLFVAGAGWTKKQADGQAHVQDAEKLILDFIRSSRASLGSTKSLVDLGGEGQAVLSFLTHFNQVGQTGSTPRHPKGLATCCHGEEPHTVGWRFINERRAVNLDPNCGWARGKADVLYVADAFAVISRLNQLLAGSKA